MPIDKLKVGDVVLVRSGEKIPVDGKVVEGQGAVDEAPITGESLPQDKSVGATVFAGTIVGSGALDICTERLGKDTTFSRIIALVETAESEQAPIQKLADKFAAWLIPVVLIFLVVVFIFTRDVRMVVTLMIFTSPAELGLATPLVMIAAIARAARVGILIKGGVYLEALAKVDAMLFDKTGTLTANQPKVVEVLSLSKALDDDAVLRIAAVADRRSAHPLAKAIVDAAIARGLDLPEPTEFEQVHGRGVKAAVDGKPVLVGNAALLTDHRVGTDWGGKADGRTPVHVAVDGTLVGIVFVADVIRPGARQIIDDLRRSGVKRIVMLTGDNQATAVAVAAQLGITEVRADLLPEDKLNEVAKISGEGFRVAFVGDGVNDAPALARSDVGIAMGAGGSQAALEAANIALMTDDLSRIPAARAIARRAYRTIQENLFVGVGVVHVLGITAALLGWIGPIEAAIIHLGPDVLVFLNSVKLLRVRIDGA